MVSRRDESLERWLYPHLYQAYLDARRHKRYTVDVHRFECALSENLAELAREIADRSYHPSRGIAFIVDKPVKREIFGAPFRDRVVHHLIYNFVYKWWDNHFIYDNYSCRVSKGTLFGIQRLYHHMAAVSHNFQQPAYVLKLDLQGYFMSLSRQRLFEVTDRGLNRQFHDDFPKYRLFQFLWRQIIFDDPTVNVKLKGNLSGWKGLPPSKSMFHAKSGHGIVIGNLTSQLLSNIYLNQLDRFVTFDLGQKHYGRYVDDFYVVSASRDELLLITQLIEGFVNDLDLVLHPRKRSITEVNQGIAFLGAVLYPYRIHPNSRIKRGLYGVDYRLYQSGFDETADSDKIVELNNSLVSYKGHVAHFHHQKLLNKLKYVPPKCPSRDMEKYDF
jgi:hypothetical protein